MAKVNFNNAVQAEVVASTLAALATKRLAWETGELARSNNTLYKLLADCLGTYCDSFLTASEEGKKAIRADITKQLQAASIKVQSNSQTVSLFVKAVFGSDRKRADKYAYVLRVAIAEQQTQATFVQWIADAGGIEQVKLSAEPSEKTQQKREAIADAVESVKEKILDARITSLGTVSLTAQVTTGDCNLLITDKAPDGSLRVVGVLPNVTDALLKRVQLEMGKLEVQAAEQSKELGQTITIAPTVNYVRKMQPLNKIPIPALVKTKPASSAKLLAKANDKSA